MPLFVTGDPGRNGVFAREQVPPSVIRANSTGVVGLVGQFPWGPGAVNAGSLQTPANPAEMLKMFAPAGSSRSGSAVLMATAFAWPRLKIVRVIGTGAAKGTTTINKTGPTALLVVTAKYVGVLGNSIVGTTSAATDGDSNHFDLTFSLSGTNGTTTETYRNCNVSGVGTDKFPSVGNADPAFDLNRSTLIGGITKSSSGLALLQTWTFTTGSDGSASGTDYTGTAGTGNAGIAALETDNTIRHILTDDPGNSLRATVNAALKTQVDTRLDRVAYISGNSGNSASAAQTDAGNYVSGNVVYVDCWANVYDDTRTLTLIPGHVAAACLSANLPPSTSIMWRDAIARRFLTNIISLEANRDGNAGANTIAGISTLIPFVSGGFCFEAGKVTNNRSQPSKGSLTRTNMGIFIASSVVDSLQSNVGAPMVGINQQDIVNAIDNVLSGLKQEQNRDPNNNAFILDYDIAEISTVNPQSALDAGEFTVAANVKVASAMERIYFSVNYGETVNIVAR